MNHQKISHFFFKKRCFFPKTAFFSPKIPNFTHFNQQNNKQETLQTTLTAINNLNNIIYFFSCCSSCSSLFALFDKLTTEMEEMTYVFLADGFEEVEAMTCVDVLRRAGMPVTTVSINSGREVTGAHGVTVLADSLFADNDYRDAQWLVLPGGIPGAPNLLAHEGLRDALLAQDDREGGIAAICASPAVVLGTLGILMGREAVCYPGLENTVEGVNWCDRQVAVDGHVVTGNGPAAATAFALAIVEQAVGSARAREVADGMLYCM